MVTKTDNEFSSTSWAPWPWFHKDEIDAASNVLSSGRVNYWTGEVIALEDGSKVRGQNGLFEYEFAKYHEVKHAIALANGTLALELALEAFDIGAGDEVITTTRTFIASASAIWMRGARPVFADIDRESQNISTDSVISLINENTKAIIAVHLAGWACEMDELQKACDNAAQKYGHKVYLIEDCAQCLGGEYKGKKLGSIGDAGCFSFCQDKIITTGGEGGMFVSNDDKAYKKAWSFKDHGKDFHKFNSSLNHPLADAEKAKRNSYYSSLGTNWRMTEIQAAIGRRALARLDSWNIKSRKEYADTLTAGFKNIKGIKVLTPPAHIQHAYYKYYAIVDVDLLKKNWSRDRVITELNKKGIPCMAGSTWNIGGEDAWKSVKMPNGDILDLQTKDKLPNDCWLGERTLMFQVHPTLQQFHMKNTVDVLTKIMSKAALA